MFNFGGSDEQTEHYLEHQKIEDILASTQKMDKHCEVERLDIDLWDHSMDDKSSFWDYASLNSTSEHCAVVHMPSKI